ncbi:MAG: hypothetical protein CVV13_06090 [Gammaproteobacteria bacterium HGW-Gammaproteobacteria-3]|jgi:hypothetical protein|nr:MAG: hypothetical protein CVV13_06090 [Gammaproteobacteria bacterium HGW-Gammaproteobacteria-3]
MVTAAINLGVFTLVFFIFGMIKPKWPLFFLNKPDRFIIIVITTIMIMVVATLFGEGHRQHLLEQQSRSPVSDRVPVPTPAPVPVPTPAPVPTPGQ